MNSKATVTNPQSLHRYSYVENNPINRLDPFGLRAEAAEIPESRLANLQANNSSGGGGGGGGFPDGAPRDDERQAPERAPLPEPVADLLQRARFESTADRSFFLKHFPKEVTFEHEHAKRGLGTAVVTGRVPAGEVLTVTSAGENLIRVEATQSIEVGIDYSKRMEWAGREDFVDTLTRAVVRYEETDKGRRGVVVDVNLSLDRARGDFIGLTVTEQNIDEMLKGPPP